MNRYIILIMVLSLLLSAGAITARAGERQPGWHQERTQAADVPEGMSGQGPWPSKEHTVPSRRVMLAEEEEQSGQRTQGEEGAPHDLPKGFERRALRIEFDNDVFFGEDNKFSNAWSLQYHGSIGRTWDEIRWNPGFMRKLGSKIPTLTASGLYYRTGIALGQILQTPDDITERDLIVDDVPYAGALALQASWYGFNDKEFRGFQFTVGVVGPASGAEQVQEFVHNIIGSEVAQGWDNQLENEPILNLSYMRKWRIWKTGDRERWSFDGAWDVDAALGNMFTLAETGLEMRFGKNVPPGFMYIPDPIGRSMQYAANLPPLSDRYSLYLSLMVRATAFAQNIFYDGNTWRDSHSVEKETFVVQVAGGITYTVGKFGLYLLGAWTTDTVDTAKVPTARPDNSIGTIMLEWRW